VDAMLKSPPASERPPSLIRAGQDPVVRLLREVAGRRSITYMRIDKGDDVVEWRRAS
jgi:hypothetical protein